MEFEEMGHIIDRYRPPTYNDLDTPQFVLKLGHLYRTTTRYTGGRNAWSNTHLRDAIALCAQEPHCTHRRGHSIHIEVRNPVARCDRNAKVQSIREIACFDF